VKNQNLFKSSSSVSSKDKPTSQEMLNTALNSWGFKNKETEQLFMQNYKKMQKLRKKKNSGMTADEKLERFKRISK
jgi:hypothetical protein